jgi:hypothetical protein
VYKDYIFTSGLRRQSKGEDEKNEVCIIKYEGINIIRGLQRRLRKKHITYQRGKSKEGKINTG